MAKKDKLFKEQQVPGRLASGKRVYFYYTSSYSKKEAKKAAKNLKKNRFRAQVIKRQKNNKKIYRVYKRHKSRK